MSKKMFKCPKCGAELKLLGGSRPACTKCNWMLMTDEEARPRHEKRIAILETDNMKLQLKIKQAIKILKGGE